LVAIRFAEFWPVATDAAVSLFQFCAADKPARRTTVDEGASLDGINRHEGQRDIRSVIMDRTVGNDVAGFDR
jgi:hypothetical protein